jgi:cysteine sulfinate desulfinase/cysteine desulfurase-like protein
MSPIYLDYNATTPVAPEVADAMLPYLREHFGNPSSSHVYGQRARDAVAQARAEVAALIGAALGELVFTSCATEANNLAILGVARALRGQGRHAERAIGALRLSLGAPTTDDEIARAADVLIAAWRALAPKR